MLTGNTPMAEITYKLDGVQGKVYAKIEAYNPTGSIKDRVAEYIISRAEENGELKPGQAIVEVTSGNTGIAFAAVGARKGYPVHIFMPSWASEERKNLMRLYGAVLHEVTREEGGFEGAFIRADALAKEIGAYLPKQFENADNVEAHRIGTGREIIEQLPDVTDFVSGIGTGGTIMGVAKALKEHGDVRITALEPDSMPLLNGGEIKGGHRIEGIGDDFIPQIVDRTLIDDVLEINDGDAIIMASRLAKELGLGVGISSGANFLAAVQVNAEGRKVATVLPDDNKKYLTTSLANPPESTSDMLSSRIELVSARAWCVARGTWCVGALNEEGCETEKAR